MRPAMNSDDAIFGRRVANTIGPTIGPRLKQNDAAIAALEARVAALEAKVDELASNQLSYEGVWNEAREYGRGSLVTHGGSMWHADQATRARPGVNAAWRLAVKRGRDGKDATK